MHGRKSGIAWKTTCCCLVSVLVAASSAFAVDKTVKVVLTGANTDTASVAFSTAAGLVKLQPAADGNRYLITAGEKVTFNVDIPGLGESQVDVVLPDNPAITVQLDLGSKLGARVVENSKSAFRPMPAVTSHSLTDVAGSAPAAVPTAQNHSISALLQSGSIQKWAPTGQKGESNPVVDPRGGPANDDCANAQAVGDGSFPFNTTGASTDGPALPAGCDEGFGLAFGQDIWFCYTATCDGTATASLCGSGYDTRMAVYDGCACPATTLVVCNDDFAGCGGNGLQSQASWTATSGNTYLIRVGGFSTAVGAGTLTISCGGGGGGGGGGGNGGDDACSAAEAISGVGVYTFDTSAASTDGNAHGACLAFGEDQIENDVWYCWTSDCDGTVRVETCGLTSVDTRIAVYNGCGVCPPTDAELIVCNDDSCSLQSRVQFAATNGATYLIRIGNYPGAGGGTGDIRIECLPPAQEVCTQSAANCQGRDQSDARNSTRGIFIVADDFTPAASGSVTGLCWWGTYFDGGGDCSGSGPDAFQVKYYADSGNVPGALLATFTQGTNLTVTRAATGNLIAGFIPEYGYSATHPAVAVAAGSCYWVEITNANAPGCSFFWEISPPGNGRAIQDATPATPAGPGDIILADLAFCLDIALGNPATCAPPPAGNDNCGDCEAISGEGTFGFDNSAASTDGPAHGLCLSFGEDQIENDVWFCWTANCDGLVSVTTCGLTAVDTRIAVYNGLACPTDDSTILACNDDACGLQSRLSFSATSGSQYLIRIGNYPGAGGGIGAFTIECLGASPCTQPSANCHTRNVADARNSTAGIFASADDFTVAADGSITGLCWWGTYFDGFGDCSGSGAGSFTVRYYADSGNLPGAVIATFTGAGLTVSAPFPTGNSIAGLVPEFEYSATHAPVPVTAGTCYWVEIVNATAPGCSWFWEIDGAGANGRLVQDGTPPNGYDAGDAENGNDLAFCLNLALGDDSICAPPPPDNDDCADAEPIACNSTATGDTTSATTDPGDPLFSCAFFGPMQGVGTLWYTFVATDTSAQVNLCDSASTDTLLAVYSGTCGALTELACNDDFSCGPIGLGSQLCVTGLTVGQTYYIQVASFSAADTGPIELDLVCPCPPAPPGDNCDDPVGPLAIPSVTMGSTVGTSIDTAPLCGTSISAPGVWYTVIGTGNTITASMCTGTPYDAKLNVYCGPCNNLTCVTGIDDFCGLQPQVSWCSQAGALYRILVQGFSGATGSFTLTLSDNGVPCTATVLCAAVGGCCIDGECIIRTEDDCAALGGDYLGDETDCSPVGGSNMQYVGNPNTAIPDNNAAGVSHTINVPDSFTIEDLNVDLTINHTWVGDLCVTLTHGATSVSLIRKPGDGLNDCHIGSPFGCSADNYNNIILDDQAGLTIESQCTTGLTSPPNYIPDQLLSAFAGQDAAGPWIMTVADTAGSDLGTFVSWSLHFSGGGTSPCVQEECDTCPPGTIAITDGGGEFSGWCASVSHPANVVINTLDVNQGTDTTNISIEKNFKEGPGFGGQIPAILIDFVQVCPDNQTTNIINIAGETILNNTGVDWRDFHWVLFDGDEAWFNVDASGFAVAPFASRLFSGFATTGSMNNAKALAAYDGIVANGAVFAPGGGAAPLQIAVDLLANDRASFTLKEFPTRDGAVTSGACCFGLTCQQTTAADCAALSGQYRGDGTVCTPATCLPPNDLCENCTPVLSGVPYAGSSEGATGTDISSCAFSDTIDVWHCWTADCTGTATISLCGSAFDTTLSVFNTCTGGGQLACNDDFAGCGGDGLQSQLTLAVTAGNTYYIRVSGFNGASGAYLLNVTCQSQSSGGPNGRPSGRVGGVSRQ